MYWRVFIYSRLEYIESNVSTAHQGMTDVGMRLKSQKVSILKMTALIDI